MNSMHSISEIYTHVFIKYYIARAGPWTPWKVLEFEISFQEHLKLLENENFSLKID